MSSGTPETETGVGALTDAERLVVEEMMRYAWARGVPANLDHALVDGALAKIVTPVAVEQARPGESARRAFGVVIREAEALERAACGRTHGTLASDHCVVVYVDGRLIGWGDDYGTFHPIEAPSSAGKLEAAGEALLAAAQDFWEAEAR